MLYVRHTRRFTAVYGGESALGSGKSGRAIGRREAAARADWTGAVIQVYGSPRHAWIECDVTTSTTRDRPFCECVLDRDICVKKLFQQNRMI